jgi:hypothetical protein
MAQYRVLQGIDYPPNKRAEVGEIVSDLPATSIKWLLEIGAIEDSSKPASKATKSAPVVEEESIVETIVEPVIEKTPVVDETPIETAPTETPVEETE